MSIGAKITSVCVLLLVVCVAAMIGILSFERNALSAMMNADLEKEALNESTKVNEILYLMCKASENRTQRRLDYNLGFATDLITSQGGISFSAETVEWDAKNQMDAVSKKIALPKVLVGTQWLGQNTDPKATAPVVDEVKRATRDFCTIFQRMNKEGDMLRVATCVLNKEGQRGVGTYIPASTPVVQSILKKENFYGHVKVVDKYQQAAYTPLLDAAGEVVGMVYVGIPMESIMAEIVDAVSRVTLGKTGYAFVVGTDGGEKGVIVAHPDANIVGQNKWDATNDRGVKIFQDFISTALKEGDGKTGSYRYWWKNKDEATAREKIAAVTYFEKWKWAICSGSYFDDYADARNEVEARLASMFWMVAGTGLGILLAAIVVTILFARTITRPLKAVSAGLIKISKGDLSTNLEYKSKDETGVMANAFREMIVEQRARAELATSIAGGNLNHDVKLASEQDVLGKALKQMVDELNRLLGEIREVTGQVSAGAGQISDASQSLSQGATEQAASLEEISSSMTEIGAQTRTNADNASQANNLAKTARDSAEKGSAQMQEMTSAMSEIGRSSREMAKIIKVIDDIAFQTNLLALNAAVEAARAGRHGKGFAVVAEEVRNLAARSAKAAKETSEMIEGAGRQVESGAEIASRTAESLAEIVGVAAKVSDLSAEVAAASSEQAQGISQVSQGLAQIDQVTQQNTANAEETASAAEELSSQASDLRRLISRFTLRTQGGVSSAPAGAARAALPPKPAQKDAWGGLETHRDRVARPSDVIALDDSEFGKY